jgi:hypothetical protein
MGDKISACFLSFHELACREFQLLAKKQIVTQTSKTGVSIQVVQTGGCAALCSLGKPISNLTDQDVA